jgi:hypothetical protein
LLSPSPGWATCRGQALLAREREPTAEAQAAIDDLLTVGHDRSSRLQATQGGEQRSRAEPYPAARDHADIGGQPRRVPAASALRIKNLTRSFPPLMRTVYIA